MGAPPSVGVVPAAPAQDSAMVAPSDIGGAAQAWADQNGGNAVWNRDGSAGVMDKHLPHAPPSPVSNTNAHSAAAGPNSLSNDGEVPAALADENAPWLATYDYVHELLNFGTALWWFLAYAALLQKLRRERSALGLSLQTLFALVVVEANNVLLIINLAIYLRRPLFYLDFWLIDCTTAVMSLYTFLYVYRKFYASYEVQKDTFGRKFCSILCCPKACTEKYYWGFLYIVSAIVAAPIFMARRSGWEKTGIGGVVINYWECFDDSILALALLPQLFMFYNRRPRVVNALLGRFVVCLLVARILAFAYWLTYPWFHEDTPRGRGVHLFTEALNLLILSDFLYYYIKAKLKGQNEVTLPI